MAKQVWSGGNMLYPLPAVMVSCADASGASDIVTVAWTGTICTNPPMLYVSIRPERASYRLIRESGEFVVNLTTRRLQRACDWCGVRSGLELAPVIAESPVNIECKVTEVKELGSHHMFLASVEAVQVDESLVDARGRLDLARAGLTAYSHGEYFELGQRLGTFGYSVRKKPAAKKPAGKKPAAAKKPASDKRPRR